MPPGFYKRTLENMVSKRTHPFFESDLGKKWIDYDGPLSSNKTYVKERNRYEYLGKNPYGKKKEIPDMDRRKKENGGGWSRRIKKENGGVGWGGVRYKKYTSREEAYEAQKQRQAEKIMCECGIMVRTGYMITHRYTKKHHQSLSNLLPPPIMDFNIEDLPPPPIEWIKDLPVETKKRKFNVKKV